MQVDSDDGRGTVGRLGAIEEAAHEVVVLQGIDLHPEGFGGVGSHILDGADGHGGQAIGEAEFFCGFGSFDLAIRVLHAGEADGGEGDGHGHVLTDKLGGRAAVGHVDGNALAEANLVEVGGVLAEGLFRP